MEADEPNQVPKGRDPAMTLIGGLLVPGAGHLYIGQRHKAVILCIVINLTILTGLWMGEGANILSRRVPWFAAQVGGGVVPLVAAYRARKLGVADASAGRYIPLYDIGTVYCAVAGLLNMLAALSAMLLCYEANTSAGTPPRGGISP